ncbi:MAG: phosphodiester glycosidase family protein [Erythrobacter sp.]
MTPHRPSPTRIASLGALAAALLLTACDAQPAGEPVVRTELGEPVESVSSQSDQAALDEAAAAELALTKGNGPCQSVTFEGVPLTHCIADPAKHRIRASLAPSSGANFGTIEGWAAGRNESDIAFVMNGGMYDDNLKAMGYFVQDSDRLVELNRADGSGNFFLKPNGVFFGSNGRWRILDTETFLRTIGDRPQFGTQSGPMLVVGGDLHPDIQDNGPSKAIRNGVGIDASGKAHFVISDAPLSFGQLARYFRDELNATNALFLDGNISSLWNPATGRMDSRRVGPLLVVETK